MTTQRTNLQNELENSIILMDPRLSTKIESLTATLLTRKMNFRAFKQSYLIFLVIGFERTSVVDCGHFYLSPSQLTKLPRKYRAQQTRKKLFRRQITFVVSPCSNSRVKVASMRLRVFSVSISFHLPAKCLHNHPE